MITYDSFRCEDGLPTILTTQDTPVSVNLRGIVFGCADITGACPDTPNLAPNLAMPQRLIFPPTRWVFKRL